MEEREFKTVENMAEKAEYTDFVIVEGEIFPEDGIPIEVIEGLTEVIDEDWLYDAYRDDRFEREKRRRDR
jgi:hypothetical protein